MRQRPEPGAETPLHLHFSRSTDGTARPSRSLHPMGNPGNRTRGRNGQRRRSGEVEIREVCLPLPSGVASVAETFHASKVSETKNFRTFVKHGSAIRLTKTFKIHTMRLKSTNYSATCCQWDYQPQTYIPITLFLRLSSSGKLPERHSACRLSKKTYSQSESYRGLSRNPSEVLDVQYFQLERRPTEPKPAPRRPFESLEDS